MKTMPTRPATHRLPVPADHPADRFFDPAHGRRARRSGARRPFLRQRPDRRPAGIPRRPGRDGYGWQGEAWIGADLDKLVIASEGEGAFGETAERIELRALWRHAIAPYFNVEAGVRHDFQPGPQRTYATFGIDGLAPYWFDVEAQLLVSDKGDVHARFEGSYDLRLTNRLILQPAVELDAAFQDVPELRTGAGFDRLEAGARLRYQITRQLAPYIGVHWERRLGETARLGALAGEGPRQSAWRSASEAGSRRQGAMTNRRKPDRTTFGSSALLPVPPSHPVAPQNGSSACCRATSPDCGSASSSS
jgi:copper resistance protein B